MAQCKERKSDGRSCKAQALAGSSLCYFHNPTSATARRDAQSRGGSNGSRDLSRPLAHSPVASPHPEFKTDSLEGIQQLIDFGINEMARGRWHAKNVHASCHAIQMALRVFELRDLKPQLDRIEQQVQALRNSPQHALGRPELLRFEQDPAIRTSLPSPSKEVGHDDHDRG